MSDFRVDFEWEQAPATRSPEMNATWARLSILVNGEPVTKVEDHTARGVRSAIYVPLYPIAEWIASNWWFLWHDWRPESSEHRHNLLHAQEGFALPDFSVRSAETTVRLSWRPRSVNGLGRISFLSAGAEVLPRHQVQCELRSFVDVIVQRLEQQGIENTFLADEWSAVRRSESDEHETEFCEISARLGVDPYAEGDSIAAYLGELDRLPATLRDDFCDAVKLSEISSGVAAVTGFLAAGGRPSSVWHELRLALRLPGALSPWDFGYQQARQLRRFLGIEGPVRGDIQNVLKPGTHTFDIAHFPAPERIDAITTSNRNMAPCFGLPDRASRAESQRFVICRALSDYLAIEGPSLVTRSQTEHQKRNRAFAAEFLAPADLLQQRLQGDRVTQDDLQDLAQEFDVSDLVIRHQVENHNLATIVD